MKKILMSLLPVMLCSFAWAEIKPSKAFDKCSEQFPSDFEIARCITTEAHKVDNRLTAEYQKLMNTMPQDKKEALRNAQRAWLKYRALETARLSWIEGGTTDRVDSAEFYYYFTVQRLDEIREQQRYFSSLY